MPPHIHRLAALLGCMVTLALVSPTQAHIDTLAQVLNPDPLVTMFEAESLNTVGKTSPQSDENASKGQAVALTQPGGGFSLSFGDLPIGIYAVYVCAKVNEPAHIKANTPLYLELVVNSRVGGGEERYIMRAPYSGKYEYMSKIYFHAPEARAYKATLRLADISQVTRLDVDRVELRNPLAGLEFRAVKNKQMLYDDSTRARLLSSMAKEGKLPRPLRPRQLSPDKRKARDAVIWNNVMPLNANPAQIYGKVYRARPAVTARLQAAEAKSGKPLGKWDAGDGHDAGQAWRIVNKELSLSYDMADYKAGRALPSPWPIPEQRGGYFFAADGKTIEKPFTYGALPFWIQQRYHTILTALGATEQGRNTSGDWVNRYLLLGDLEAAADAALLLTAFAYRYPAYDYNLHCMTNIAPVGRTFAPGHGYGRGCSYAGWSTPEIQGVLRAYDKLFPYIKDNQGLADRVNRFVPWVKSPDDVIKLLDTFLVQRAAQDGAQVILYAYVIPTAATILGPNATSERILDGYFRRAYLRSSLSGFRDHLISGNSRDGLNYIGSTYYTAVESVSELLDISSLLGRYAALGGAKRFDTSNPREYPRAAALADSLVRLHVAGGQRPGSGDVMDPAYPPRQTFDDLKDKGPLFLAAWRHSRDPRYAWLLVDRYGQGNASDREWKQITEMAANTRDPVLHQGSHVLEGYGLAMLNEGVDSTDRRHKNAATLRFGIGSGHAHADTLDLEVYAHGTRMTSDLGGRSSGAYGHPNCMATYVHNLVEVDEKSFNSGVAQNATGEGWLQAFKPNPGAQFVKGAASASGFPHVSRYERSVLQVMCDPGDGDRRTPSGYIFDVFRVDGGKVHTFNFHGCVSEAFTANANLKPAESELAKRYLSNHLKGTGQEGTAPDILEATWTMRRTAETVNDIELKNFEQFMLREDYDETRPRKFTRLSLFGHAGAKVMVGNWYARGKRKHNFPFLHVRQEAQTPLSSTFVSLIEPYAGESFIRNKRALSVTSANGDVDGRAVALETTFGQKDVLFAGSLGNQTYDIDGGITGSGELSFVSEDADGIRLAQLVGGTVLAKGKLRIELDRPWRESEIASCQYKAHQIRLKTPLPAAVLDGEVLTVGRPGHWTTHRAVKVAGGQITFERTPLVGVAGVERVKADGHAVLDLAPYLYNYHPEYYNGMTATSESGKVLGRMKIRVGDRFWYLGFPEARRHRNRMTEADISDANGDGKRILTMIATLEQKQFAEDGSLVRTKPGEKMLELEVTKVREDGLMFWTKQHPRTFLDALKIPHPGWPYHQQRVRNEAGDREWIANMPGDSYELSVDGRPLGNADFDDPNNDGRRMVRYYDYGPGDMVRVRSHAYLRRVEAGKYELRANAACSISLPGKAVKLSTDGEAWTELKAKTADGMVTAALSVPQMAQGQVYLQVAK